MDRFHILVSWTHADSSKGWEIANFSAITIVWHPDDNIALPPALTLTTLRPGKFNIFILFKSFIYRKACSLQNKTHSNITQSFSMINANYKVLHVLIS